MFVERQLHAFFDFYRTANLNDLELRLSEMFALERRGYVVDPLFQRDIHRFLDSLDVSAQECKMVDTVINQEGVLIGYCFTGSHEEVRKRQLALWFPET